MMDQISTSEILFSNEKSDFESDLIRNLNLAKKFWLKKVLFKAYHLLSASWGNDRFHTLRNCITHCAVIIKQCQLLFLILFVRKKPSDSNYDTFVQEFLKLFMVDIFTVYNGHQDKLTAFIIISTFCMMLIFVLLMFQDVAKKFMLKTPSIICANTITWCLNTILTVPVMIYSCVYIKHFPFTSKIYVKYYKSTLQFNMTIGILLILSIFITIIHLLFVTIFHNTSLYTSNITRSRSCSVVPFKQLLCIFSICFIFVFLNHEYFLIFSLALSAYMLKEFIYFHPYYSFYNNLIESGFWLMIFTSSLLILIENSININSTSLLCIIFLLPLEYLLLGYYLKKSFGLKINKDIDNPTLLELKIRNVLYKNNEISEEDIVKIQDMFNCVTGLFLEYNFIAIWEHNFILQSSGNINLAMVKLMKTIFSEKRPDVLRRPDKVFLYWPKIECEYIVYVKSKEIQKQNNFKDVALIKYIKDLYYFNKCDNKTCHELLSLIDTYLNSNEVSKKYLIKKFENFFTSMKNKDQFLVKSLGKYGNDWNFLDKNQSFQTDIIKMPDLSNSINTTKTKENYIDKITGNNSGKSMATIIISGYPDIIGRIIYASEQAANLLNYPSIYALIGKNFINLIPQAFLNFHKSILTKFLLFSYKVQLSRPEIFLVDYNGFSIEVIMEIRTTFYAGIPYFIVEFIEKIPTEYSILCSETGEIFTTSPELKTMFSMYNQNIEQVFPNVMRYLQDGKINDDFLYKEDGKIARLRWNQVRIDNKTLLILYFLDESKFKHFIDLSSDRPLLLRKRSTGVSYKSIEESKELKRNTTIIKRKIRKSSEQILTQKLIQKDYTKTIKANLKPLLYSHYISTILTIILYLSIIMYTSKFVNDNYLSTMLTDVCSFRYKTASIAMRTRSIELLRKGFPCNSNLTQYNNSISASTNMFKLSLDNLNTWNSEYKIMDHFKQTKITLWDFENKIETPSDQTLYQAMYLFIGRITQFIDSEYNDKDNMLYIYRNTFNALQHLINLTTYKCLISVIRRSLDIFYAIDLIKGFIIVPYTLICLFSIPFMLMIVSVNKNLWDNINGIPRDKLFVLRSRVVERIKNVHFQDFTEEYHLNQNGNFNSNIWIRYTLKVLIALGTTIIFYVLILYFCEDKLKFLIKIRLEHIFFGGLRTLTVKAFMWAREAHLSQLNISYEYIFPEYLDISSSHQQFIKVADEIEYYAKYVLLETQTLKSNSQYFTKYIDFLIGNTCLYTDLVANCSNTILTVGVNQAILGYIKDLRYLAESKEIQLSYIENLEYTTSLFEKSLTSGIYLYGNVTDEFIVEARNLTHIISSFFIGISIVLLVFVIYPEINEIKKELLSRNEFVLLFKNFNTEKTMCYEENISIVI
ncbi:hypothetical protein SteCoe_17556 [Stentor coeruleus]|uniref:PAS domain-containing protein n=1 Tax=Stentor coeruleus TaxID=5963 RepID=A0A1R2BYR4_9CILI|nr:hypothetical protein SteCoe_17556 [Stentor coeruleus]